jgi:hypothetical protein
MAYEGGFDDPDLNEGGSGDADDLGGDTIEDDDEEPLLSESRQVAAQRKEEERMEKIREKARVEELINRDKARRFDEDKNEDRRENIPLLSLGTQGNGKGVQNMGTIESISSAEDIITEEYPDSGEFFLKSGKNEYNYDLSSKNGEVIVNMGKGRGKNESKWHYLKDNGKRGFPTTITKALGKSFLVTLEEKSVTLEKEKEVNNRVAKALKDKEDKLSKDIAEGILDKSEIKERKILLKTQKDELKTKVERLKEIVDDVNTKLEEYEGEMSLRDRVKRIFKKYGFTAAAVLSSIGVIIGVIVSNLKSGLGNVAKGMGNGLKAVGKKLGQILPGIAGAIASTIFKAAGEVVGFLGKHAWLLIVGLVLLVIDQVKGRSSNKK